MDFLQAIKNRRTYYGLTKENPAGDERVKEIMEEALKYTPSAFNSQSTRIILLLDKEHDKFWDITMEALRKIVPPDSFSKTEEKINSFKAGYGTVLFYEDMAVVEKLQEDFSLYEHNFPKWSRETNGMHQLVVWTALEIEGLGASLQHYNELVEEDIKKEWNIDEKWKLIGQMPFGKANDVPEEKQYNSLEDRLKIYK